MECNLRTSLDWAAVLHFNTGEMLSDQLEQGHRAQGDYPGTPPSSRSWVEVSAPSGIDDSPACNAS
jgi:hypothetical protein